MKLVDLQQITSCVWASVSAQSSEHSQEFLCMETHFESKAPYTYMESLIFFYIIILPPFLYHNIFPGNLFCC